MAFLRQAGAIPFRLVDGGDVEFLVITSTKGNWIFPKGIIEKDERMLSEILAENGLARIHGFKVPSAWPGGHSAAD